MHKTPAGDAGIGGVMDYVKRVYYQFMCAVCQCSDDYEAAPHEGLRDAAREMRKSGWNIGDRNICPNCQKSKV